MDLQQWLETVVGTAVAMAPIVTLLVAVVKTGAGENLPARYYPAVSLALGVGVALAISWMVPPLMPLKTAPLSGAIAGGIASGLFTWGKTQELLGRIPH